MQELKKTINEIIGNDEELVFLVGSGSSTDSPSNLDDCNTLKQHIINYVCAESEIEQLIQLHELKFETLIGILCNQIDPKLDILDYYELCTSPNFQHFFLASMIKKGHTVLTTNLDFLIEQALLQIGLERDSISLLITRSFMIII